MHSRIVTYKETEFRESIQYIWEDIIAAGDFFSYDKPTVEVCITNTFGNHTTGMRHYAPGFYVDITTIDDAALYADWDTQPFHKVLEVKAYFYLKEAGLKSAEDTLKDLEGILGKCKSFDFS